MPAIVLVALLAVATLLPGCGRTQMDPWEPVPHARGSRAVDRLDERQVLAVSRLSGAWSRAITMGAVDAPMAGMLLAALVLSWTYRRRARAEAAVDPRAPLVSGPAVVVGVVELEAGDGRTAIELRVRQRGTESADKGSWSHRWDETGREVRARPFWVRRDDGVRVRVEPVAGKFALHDALSRVERRGPADRTRIAELTAGERVFVAGTLTGAAGGAPPSPYRSGGGTPVVRAPAFGRLLVSTEPPGGTSAAQARFHRNWAVALVVFAAMLSAFLIPTYRVLTLFGEPVTADAVATRHWREWVKPKNGTGHWSDHYVVRARLEVDGASRELEDDCRSTLHALVRSGEQTAVPFVVVPSLPVFSQLGLHPTLVDWQAFVLIAVVVVLLLAYVLTARAMRPWYARRKIVDVGSGRLAA